MSWFYLCWVEEVDLVWSRLLMLTCMLACLQYWLDSTGTGRVFYISHRMEDTICVYIVV